MKLHANKDTRLRLVSVYPIQNGHSFSPFQTLVIFRSCICRTKQFVRWMHGTCIETPPQHADGEDEPVVFSFFSDIANDATVIELVQNISKTVQSTLGSLNKFLSRWKRYRVLWKLDKVLPV